MFDLRRVLEDRRDDDYALLDKHLNPWTARMLRGAGCNVRYDRAHGAYLVDTRGQEYLDLFGGFGVFTLGRNHPTVVKALEDALALKLPNLVQLDVPLLPGLVAESLVRRAPWLEKVFFCNSGTETVEAGLKLACAVTGRRRIVHLKGAFHGLTTGALSLGQPEFKRGYEPLLFDSIEVAMDDTVALEHAFRGGDVAAFFFEPILGTTVTEVTRSFLARAYELCIEHDALVVADEVQTGCGRTGKFLAVERSGIEPDVVLLSKGLSGGLVPVGAVMARPDVFDSVFNVDGTVGSHGCTFSKNTLAMVAALATLHVIDDERLVERAEKVGERFLQVLEGCAHRHDAIKSARGYGCMIAVELDLAVFPRAATYLSVQLLKEHRILTQPTGPSLSTLKLLPPLVTDPEAADVFGRALDSVLASTPGGRRST